jgi:hypothetical protein
VRAPPRCRVKVSDYLDRLWQKALGNLKSASKSRTNKPCPGNVAVDFGTDFASCQ